MELLKTERYERSFLVKNEEEAYKAVQPNDFAYNPMNLRFGALARHTETKAVKVSKYYNIFSVNPKADIVFADYLLTKSSSIRFYDSIAMGSLVEKKRVHFSDFLKSEFLLPPIAEQEKIASFLGAVDTRISQLRRKHELLQTYKRGVMQKLFSQQIRFKGDDGQPFPDWKNKKLGEIASFFKGKGLSKENLDNAGKLKCIRYAELYTMYGEIINYVFSRTNLDPDDLILSKVNDVIIPSSGETAIDIAKAACVCIEGVVLGGDINILRSKIDGRFLAHYLNHYKKHEIASAAQGNTVVHLYNSHLKNIEIDIPTNKEQEKIAEFLIAIDQKIEAVAKQIELTEQFKKGLLQKMFV